MVDFNKALARSRVRDGLNAYLDSFVRYAYSVGNVFDVNHDEITKELIMAIDKKLSQLSKDWKEAEVLQSDYSNVPDGEYTGQIKEMVLDEAKKTGRLQVVTSFEIMDGEHQGQIVKRFDGLVDKINMGYFKGLCGILGFEFPEDLELLSQAMDEFVANSTDLFDFRIVTKKGKEGQEYTNLYVSGLSDLTLGEEAQDEEVEDEEVEDEEVEDEEVEEEEVVEEEAVEEEVPEEEAEEEVVEEEQQIVAPIKRFTAKPVQSNVKKVTQTAKPATKKLTTKSVATKPVAAKAATKVATKPVVKTVRRRVA